MSADIKKITQELNDKAVKRQKDIDDLQTQIAMDETLITAAEKAMTEASDQDDVTAYKQAKQDRQDAIDAKEMHEAHLKKMTGVPELSEAEYQKVIDDVKAESDRKVEAIRQKVADITNELIPVQAELQTVSSDATAAMHAAHDMAFPDGKNSKGWVVGVPVYHGCDGVTAWIMRAIGSKQERDGK